MLWKKYVRGEKDFLTNAKKLEMRSFSYHNGFWVIRQGKEIAAAGAAAEG